MLKNQCVCLFSAGGSSAASVFCEWRGWGHHQSGVVLEDSWSGDGADSARGVPAPGCVQGPSCGALHQHAAGTHWSRHLHRLQPHREVSTCAAPSFTPCLDILWLNNSSRGLDCRSDTPLGLLQVSGQRFRWYHSAFLGLDDRDASAHCQRYVAASAFGLCKDWYDRFKVQLKLIRLNFRTHTLGAEHRMVTWWEETGLGVQEQSGELPKHSRSIFLKRQCIVMMHSCLMVLALQIFLWDPVTGAQMGRTLTGHQKWITWLCWEPLHRWVLNSSLSVIDRRFSCFSDPLPRLFLSVTQSVVT